MGFSCKKASLIIFFALQLQVPRDDADAAINKGDDETKKNLAFLLEKVEGESEIFRFMFCLVLCHVLSSFMSCSIFYVMFCLVLCHVHSFFFCTHCRTWLFCANVHPFIPSVILLLPFHSLSLLPHILITVFISPASSTSLLQSCTLLILILLVF